MLEQIEDECQEEFVPDNNEGGEGDPDHWMVDAGNF